eukprot:gb/GECG01006811.1/.p1 GENE.gb/GECG01006811.1/~~gb/GECG01006811.1/.p1  ORF type:complete len:303 (+),score=14.11 gb/GECG01006811.1/:1-909(+)
MKMSWYKEIYLKHKNRIMMDYALLKSNRTWLKIIGAALTIGYLQTVIGRNIAFYRHRPLAWYVKNPEILKQTHLKDLGFEIIPDMSDSHAVGLVNELFQYFFGFAVAAVALFPYFKDHRLGGFTPYYTINIMTRLLYAIATGEVLRMMIYIPTSLPGTAKHCVGEIEARNRPKSLSEIFGNPKTAQNCGDLIFSGHMFFATTTACLFWYYFRQMTSKRTAVLVTIFMSVMAGLQVIFVLLSRSHYSVDITSGIIIGYLQFHVHSHVWRPKDPEPPKGRDTLSGDGAYSPVGSEDNLDRKAVV